MQTPPDTPSHPESRDINTKGRVSELIAALMKAPRTLKEAMAMTGMSEQSCEGWLAEFVASGLVQKTQAEPDGRKGPRPFVYIWQPRPFAYTDQPAAEAS